MQHPSFAFVGHYKSNQFPQIDIEEVNCFYQWPPQIL